MLTNCFTKFYKNWRPKFSFLIVLFFITLYLFSGISFFEVLFISYILYSFYGIFCHYYNIIYRFLKTFFSAKNISIRLSVWATGFLLLGYPIFLLVLAKGLTTLSVKMLYGEKLTTKGIVIFFVFCIASCFFPILLSSSISELYSLNMLPWGSTSTNPRRNLPGIFDQLEQQQEFREHQISLQEVVKNNGDINYNDLVPTDLTDYNIAKANNAYEKIKQESYSINGQMDIAKKSSDLLSKMHTEGFSNGESSIHSRFTYSEIAILKFFGKNYPIKIFPGYNGIIHENPFNDTGIHSIEIKHSIIPGKSEFGNHFESQVQKYKLDLKTELEKMNSQVWKTD